MILKAKSEGNILVFNLEGQLDFETTAQLKSTCQDLMSKNQAEKLVFNFEKLRFVGSCGMHQFVRVLKEFNSLKQRPKYCRVSSEFLRILKAFQNKKYPFEIFESQEQAVLSFDQPEVELPKKRGRKKLNA